MTTPTCVKLDGKYAFYIPYENRYLIDMTFSSRSHFGDYEGDSSYGLAIVRKDGKLNVLRIDGTFVLDKWYDFITWELFGDGIFVGNSGEDNYIYNIDGTLRKKVVLPKVSVTIGHGYREGR